MTLAVLGHSSPVRCHTSTDGWPPRPLLLNGGVFRIANPLSWVRIPPPPVRHAHHRYGPAGVRKGHAPRVVPPGSGSRPFSHRGKTPWLNCATRGRPGRRNASPHRQPECRAEPDLRTLSSGSVWPTMHLRFSNCWWKQPIPGIRRSCRAGRIGRLRSCAGWFVWPKTVSGCPLL